MYVKVKINENHEFKQEIIQRIQEELHKLLKDDFKSLIFKFVENEINKNKHKFTDIITNRNIKKFVKNYVEHRIDRVVGDTWYSKKNIDKYIEERINKVLETKVIELFNEKFQLRDDPNKGEKEKNDTI